MKVVINKCYGGFSLSREAIELLRKMGCRAALECPIRKGEKYSDGSEFGEYGFLTRRSDVGGCC